MISIIIPYIDGWEILERTLQKLAQNTTEPCELVLIDNGSDKSYTNKINKVIGGSKLKINMVRNRENIGVLPTFKQGYQKAKGDILFYMHSDVLIHDLGWNERVVQAFAENNELGMAGLFGARGVQPDGGREGCMSNMLGKEWGTCSCHEVAALHHGEREQGVRFAVVFDGVGLFFTRQCMQDIVEKTDMFNSRRAMHHFYDRIITLKAIELGYQCAVIGIGFDHYSGATANHSQKYLDAAEKWCKEHDVPYNGVGWDDTVYRKAESQWFEEYAQRLPLFTDPFVWSLKWTVR